MIKFNYVIFFIRIGCNDLKIRKIFFKDIKIYLAAFFLQIFLLVNLRWNNISLDCKWSSLSC